MLLAASDQRDEARALWEEVRSEGSSLSHGCAALAAGDFEPPEHKKVREDRLSCMGAIARFWPIAEDLARAAPALLADLPRFFEQATYPEYSAIWTPVLQTFALMSEQHERVIDRGYSERLAEISSVQVLPDFGFTCEHKREGLRTMFWLAMHQGRLLSAHRVARQIATGGTSSSRANSVIGVCWMSWPTNNARWSNGNASSAVANAWPSSRNAPAEKSTQPASHFQ